MPSPAVGVLLLVFGQLAPGGQPSASPTPASPPVSQIRIAGGTPEPTLAEPIAAGPGRYGDASAAGAPDAAAAFQAPAAPLERPPAADVTLKPRDLMRSLTVDPVTYAAFGTPMKLADVLETARSRREQTERTIAYWDLSAAMTRATLAEREAAEIAALRQEAPAAALLWDAKERDLDLETQLATQDVSIAQRRLQAMIAADASPSDPLPVAVDVPHCGRYETRYEEIFAGRANATAADLSKALGLRHEQLSSSTAAIAEALGWLGQARQQAAINPAAAADVVHAQDQVTLRLKEFVDAAYQYNQEIASYAELAAPGNVGTERLVGMLIRTSATEEGSDVGVRQDASVTPAAALEPLNNPPAPELTEVPAQQTRQRAGLFGAGRTEVRRPLLDRLLSREHSILRRRPRGN